MEKFEQLPIPPNEWLYEDKEGYRSFYKAITMPIGSKLLNECTDEEKTAWEEAHKAVDEPVINPL